MKLFRLLTDCKVVIVPYRKNNYLQVIPIIPDPSLKIQNFCEAQARVGKDRQEMAPKAKGLKA